MTRRSGQSSKGRHIQVPFIVLLMLMLGSVLIYWNFDVSLAVVIPVTAGLGVSMLFLLWARFYSEVHNEKRVMTSMFYLSTFGMLEIDRAGNIKRLNAVAADYGGYTPDDINGLLGESVEKYIEKESLRSALNYVRKTREGFPQIFETVAIHKSGFRVDLLVNSIPLDMDSEVKGDVMLVCQDITERKRADERIKMMAYYDDLTGLPNRRLFRDQLEQAINYFGDNEGIAMLIIDIDRFKLINDSLGHDYGDILLLQFAERLTRCINEGELVARIEADQFAIFYIGVKQESDLKDRADQIYVQLETPFVLQDHQVHIHISTGAVMINETNQDVDAITKNADTALSRAKDLGKNNMQIYSVGMQISSYERLTLENELRRALDQREFELYYQPQISLVTGEILGAEALIRWRHPIKGLVPPSKFISLAEDSGLIVNIGYWVIKSACEQIKRWEQSGMHLSVSVNLSFRQLIQQHFIETVKQIIQETDINPAHLEFEITESMTFDVERSIKQLNDLKHIGIGISIDDFGTGYSSLSYLKTFPIDKLKIDRSFVRNIMDDPNDAAIVTTIIAIAKHLNMKVIAEGVETSEQLHFLNQHQCHEVQGFIFSPPVPINKFEELLKTQAEAAANKLNIHAIEEDFDIESE